MPGQHPDLSKLHRQLAPACAPVQGAEQLSGDTGAVDTARVGAVELNNDGTTRTDIAPGTTRNQFRLPSVVTLEGTTCAIVTCSLRAGMETNSFIGRDLRNTFRRLSPQPIDSSSKGFGPQGKRARTGDGRPRAADGKGIAIW